MKAPVNKIINSSVVDGDGNRTVIFFQSCNFNCRYCHNPETIHQCQNCYLCVEHCPKKALTIQENKVVYHRQLCCQCDQCIRICPNGASPKICYMEVDEIVEVIKENQPFIRGITVSGGECTLQMEFVKQLFHKVKQLGLSTLLDSNGSYDFEKNPEALADCDGVMLDIKATDPEKHMWLTGQSNQLVLKNAVYLAQKGKLAEIRTVCVEEFLDNEGTIQAVGALLKESIGKGKINYKLIQYRPYGVRDCYQYLKQPTAEQMQVYRALAYQLGFKRVTII